jgi:signal peptidase II
LLRKGLAIAVFVIVLDQLTKWVMLGVFEEVRLVPVTSFFDLVLVWNRGISFGMFGEAGDWGPWILTGFACLVILGLTIWLARAATFPLACGLGLVIGGAVGNVIDRVRFGAVVDFLDFHVAGYHWPAFNVADSAITVGAVLLIADSLLASKRRPT